MTRKPTLFGTARYVAACMCTVLLLADCGPREDRRTYQGESGILEIAGTLDKRNVLRIDINGTKVIEEKVALSREKLFFRAVGTYGQKPVESTCTISSFSKEAELFCTVVMDSREVASLRLK